MAETYCFIKDLINDLERGKMKVPSFQRGFVWERERVAYFIDSIYKGFPFGSILLWRTKTPLRTERNLGAYKLPNNDPDYPIDYILDGQQRTTSIFGVFQTSLNAEEGENIDWTHLFFELNSQESVPFQYLEDFNNYDNTKYFPLKYVFDAPKYRQITRNLEESIAQQIDDLVERFTKARISIERFETEKPEYVATVFERINRQGVELDTLQLLSVWNWSDDFDLQEKFREIAEELEPFGFKEIGSNLLLKCCSAIVNNTANPNSFISLSGNTVREKFEEINTGIFGAIDFLKKNLNVFSLKLLPMENILVVLAALFASPQKQPSPILYQNYKSIYKWFWRACFSERYAIGGTKSADLDLEEVKKLKAGEAHRLGEFTISLSTDFFLKKTFRSGTVASSVFVLLLAQEQPLNFIQGTKISLEAVLQQGNRKEFHHIFPKAYLKRENPDISSEKINCLGNFSILSRTDNNSIKDLPPSQYVREKMPSTDPSDVDKILKTHFCSSQHMKSDDFDSFLITRAELMLQKAKDLCEIV
jgi:hypothetical protein